MRNIKNTVVGKNSVVVLMHDSSGKDITYKTLEEVIEHLKSLGYIFKSFYDIF